MHGRTRSSVGRQRGALTSAARWASRWAALSPELVKDLPQTRRRGGLHHLLDRRCTNAGPCIEEGLAGSPERQWHVKGAVHHLVLHSEGGVIGCLELLQR